MPDVTLTDLKPHPRNYNVHSDAQIARLAESLRRFGQSKEIVIWRGLIIAGHGLVEAARKLGWPALRANDMTARWSETEALAYMAADNELARLGDPDEAALAALAMELAGVDKELAELAAGTEERLAEMQAAVLQEIEAGDAGKRHLATPTLIRLVVDVADVGIVERAIAATSESNRGEAIMVLCREFLRAKGQLDRTAEGAASAKPA
jgi:ParB-like chromosome segregation protein Spo0J